MNYEPCTTSVRPNVNHDHTVMSYFSGLSELHVHAYILILSITALFKMNSKMLHLSSKSEVSDTHRLNSHMKSDASQRNLEMNA